MFHYIFLTDNILQNKFKCGAAAVPLAVLGAGALAAGGSVYSSAKQRSHDEEMFEKQKEFELQKFELENQYNKPSSQKQRLIDAGFNPALMASSGAVSSGNSTGIGSPSQGANQLPTLNTEGLQNAISEASMFNARKSNLQSSTENLDANTQYQVAQTSGQKETNKWISIKEAAEAMKNIKQAEESGANVQHLKNLASWEENTMQERIKSEQLKNANIEADTLYKKSMEALNNAQIELAKANTGLSIAQQKSLMSKLQWEIGLIRNQAYFYSASAYKDYQFGISEDTLREFEKDMRNIQTEYTKTMNEVEKANFNNWYIRYILPALGGAGSSLGGAAMLYKVLPK